MNTTESSSSERGATRTRGRTGAVLALLIASHCVSIAAAEVSVSPSVARLFVGEEKVVEGPVTAAERETNVVHLHLGKSPQETVVSLVIGLLATFPPLPEQYYLGKTVRVAGTIRSFRGTPEIVVRDAADIQVVSSTSAAPGGAPANATARAGRAAASAAGAGDEPSEQRRLETLGRQLRVLEERVQQLEEQRAHP